MPTRSRRRSGAAERGDGNLDTAALGVDSFTVTWDTIFGLLGAVSSVQLWPWFSLSPWRSR